MKYLYLLCIFLCVASVQAVENEDKSTLGYHLEVCTTCTSNSQFQSVALKAEAFNGKVVISNVVTGVSKAFEVETETEPGFQYRFAFPVSVPNEVNEAVDTYRKIIKDAEILTGQSISKTTPLIPVVIPDSINGVNTATANTILSNDPSALIAVSNYLRVQLLEAFHTKLTLAFKMLVKKMKFTVEVTFSDLSKAQFVLINPLDGATPFGYIEGSAKNANGSTISSNNGNGGYTGGGGSSYDSYGGGFGGGGSYGQRCVTYAISDSYGNTNYGLSCWVYQIP